MRRKNQAEQNNHASRCGDAREPEPGQATAVELDGVDLLERIGQACSFRLDERVMRDAEQPDNADLVGQQFGHFQVEDEIACGGMGRVLRVWDFEMQRHLAMKVVRESRHSERRDPDRAVRFFAEARLAGKLDHPGIAPVHEIGTTPTGDAYFTMKLVEGEDLKVVFDRFADDCSEWARDAALRAVIRACETIAYAHSKHILHRDIKPANIMVGRLGEVYVMDWGLAIAMKRMEATPPCVDEDDSDECSEQGTSTTRHGSIAGIFVYMAPEQARGELERLDERTDVYSLGAVLYHLLCGEAPFQRERLSTSELLMRVRRSAPLAVAALRPGLPARLVAICERAMAREKGDRYASALDLANALRAYLNRRSYAGWIGRTTRKLRASGKRALLASTAAAVIVSAGIAALHRPEPTVASPTSKAPEVALAPSQPDEVALKAGRVADRLSEQSQVAIPASFSAQLVSYPNAAPCRREATESSAFEALARARVEPGLIDFPVRRGSTNVRALERPARPLEQLERSRRTLDRNARERAWSRTAESSSRSEPALIAGLP